MMSVKVVPMAMPRASKYFTKKILIPMFKRATIKYAIARNACRFFANKKFIAIV